MTATLGTASLLLALALAIAGIVAPFVLRRRPVAVGAAMLAGQIALVTLAGGLLVYALITGNFSLEYVAHNSSLRTPLYNRITGLWAALEGSLLLWEWMLVVFAGVVAWQHRGRQAELMPWVLGVFSTVSAFFLSVLAFAGNPFVQLSPVPLDGRGLNPLLEDADMFTHPPLLYAGFVALTVPYAFAVAALITGRIDEAWTTTVRRWTISGWLFLTLGNLFGGWWSYHVLGWGGYWAWDPVENAAFLPWLPATAFLHSIQIQERRGMLKVWNLSLIIVAFALIRAPRFLQPRRAPRRPPALATGDRLDGQPGVGVHADEHRAGGRHLHGAAGNDLPARRGGRHGREDLRRCAVLLEGHGAALPVRAVPDGGGAAHRLAKGLG